MRRRLWMLLALLVCVSGEYLMGGHLDNNAGSTTRSGKIDSSSVLGRKTRLDDLDLDLVAAESTVVAGTETSTGDDGVLRYHIPPFAFNGGKPFSLEKDPITGKIDFEKAPPVKALNYTGRYREREDKESKDGDDNRGAEGSVYPRQEKIRNKDRNGPNEITPNFHDFNLPVHYSSDKYGNDKYPLISSSYANTKVQSGTNSYSTYNHRHSESDLYVHPVKSYPSTKTSTYRTTTVNDLKTKEISTTSPLTTFASLITTNSALSTSTKAPVITTWKPFNSAITFHSINRFEAENEKNLLPIEKLHASTHTGSHRNSSDVSTKSPSEGTTDKAPVTSRYKDQSNLDNLVVHETKPQNEEHKESYDIYDESNGESADNNEDNYSYNLWLDLLKEDDTSTPSTTTSSTTTSTTTASIIMTSTVPKSSAETTTSTTVAPLRSVSSTLPTNQKDVSANKPLVLHHPISPSSSFNRYRPNPIIKYNNELNRIGAPVIESTSNILIPPDQNMVAFVLGNRQNVDGGHYSVGTVVGENPYGGSSETNILWSVGNDPHNPSKEVKHEHLPISVTELNPDRVTQKWSSPSPLKSSNEISPTRPQSPLLAVTVIQDTKNTSKDSGYVIFPEEEQTKNKNTLKEEHTLIINEADGSIHELPPKITLTMSTSMNKTKFNPPANVAGNMPQLAEDLMPPAESTRPPSNYYYYQFEPPRPNQVRPQRLPLPSRIKPHLGPVPPMDVGVRKRPYPADTKLPNILPQFRPNAKASHGHRSPDVIGTMQAGQSVSTRIRQPLPVHPSRRPLPLPPLSHLQRLNPPPPPIHAVKLAFTPTSKVDGAILPHEMDPAIRRLRPLVLPGIPNSISRPEENAPSNRLLPHGGDGEGGESRNEDRGKSEIADERESEGPEKYPEEPPMTPPRPPLFPKRRTADPPRVTTLQMIQHHGEFGDEGDEAQLAQPVEPVLAHEAERRKSDNHDPSEIPEQPVYVVYPVNTAVNIHSDDSNEKDGSVVVGTRGPQRPLPPDTLLQNEQDDTHTVYSGRPVALDFPYPLERPDPSSVFPVGVKETPVLIPNEQRQQQQQQASAAIANEQENEKNDAVNVIPYLQDFSPYRKKNDAAISVTLHRIPPVATSSSSLMSSASTSTSTPIAYVYTPTHAPYPAHLDKELDVDDDAAASIDAKQTELLPSQQPSSSSSSAPAPQNFMAPFVASMSAETPSKNGWSVVVVEPPAGAEKKSDSDSDEEKPADSENDMQTERNEFDADNFKPQLFGGFKPLYEFPSEDVERQDVADMDTETNMPRHSKEMLPVPDRG
ncbi:PREDICTED: uncharacterized protein LOC108762932 [Trachymyrmex cornetzi]|uniref:Uncharacterized protein n=1 Tax=Trachymyrmex cornetzi TaxID=471704 RepID=A0A195DYW0_9HYME|nr:PREDICTED: uncharacterized protein LOC108762932 [Trachymyrmex cornetzi]KYN17912.1 hypothetical protein ALC57_09794 [Trachymyrmex cornetzi]